LGNFLVSIFGENFFFQKKIMEFATEYSWLKIFLTKWLKFATQKKITHCRETKKG
jgi:hypothetical protein